MVTSSSFFAHAAITIHTHNYFTLSRNAAEFYLKANDLYKQIPGQIRRSNFPRDHTFKSRLRYLSANYLPKKKNISTLLTQSIPSIWVHFPLFWLQGCINFFFQMETADSATASISVKFLTRTSTEFQYHEFSGALLIRGLHMVIYVIIDCRPCTYPFTSNES